MAKGNAFLGSLRRSIGDVTFFRRDGEQLARQRIRSVANPKTTGQSLQRAFFAPVARFYSPYAVALESSYEGLSRSKSYSAFLQQNIALARSSGWYLPKGSQFFPLPYKVSRGSIAPCNAEVSADGDEVTLSIGAVSSSYDDGTIGAWSRMFEKVGYQEGDQVTFLAVLDLGGGDYLPDYVRFNLSAASTQRIIDVLGGHQFSYVEKAATSENVRYDITEADYPFAAFAVIISRFANGVWRRSTQYISLRPDLLAMVTSADARETAIRSYGPSVTLTESSVYLNGDDSYISVSLRNGTAATLVSLTTYKVGELTYAMAVDQRGNYHYIIKDSTDVVLREDMQGWVNLGSDVSPTQLLSGVDVSRNAGLQEWLQSQGVPLAVFQ